MRSRNDGDAERSVLALFAFLTLGFAGDGGAAVVAAAAAEPAETVAAASSDDRLAEDDEREVLLDDELVRWVEALLGVGVPFDFVALGGFCSFSGVIPPLVNNPLCLVDGVSFAVL